MGGRVSAPETEVGRGTTGASRSPCFRRFKNILRIGHVHEFQRYVVLDSIEARDEKAGPSIQFEEVVRLLEQGENGRRGDVVGARV